MLEEFLAAAGWSGARREPLAGDASRRRYERISRTGASAILMIAPPDASDEMSRFARLSAHLRSLGLSAPEVLSSSPDAGLMLLEDLGNSLYPAAIGADPTLEPELYRTALDCLFVLQQAAPPADISDFTSEEMARQAALPLTTYTGAAPGTPCPYEAGLREALHAMRCAPVLMLRDFHAENLFWLPERAGVARVGLIDFQDARLASPLYDVVSLLWDARRDLASGLRSKLLAHTADALGVPLPTVQAEAATLTLQRNLRILGIFARLAVIDGKTGYLAHIPRVWRYIEDSLDAPHLANLKRPVLETLPPPTETLLTSLRARCDLTPIP